MPTRPRFLRKGSIISDAARADIHATIMHLVETAGGDVAARFLQRIDDELSALADPWPQRRVPRMDQSRPSPAYSGDYCIYFRVTYRETRIVRFLHGARDVRRDHL